MCVNFGVNSVRVNSFKALTNYAHTQIAQNMFDDFELAFCTTFARNKTSSLLREHSSNKNEMESIKSKTNDLLLASIACDRQHNTKMFPAFVSYLIHAQHNQFVLPTPVIQSACLTPSHFQIIRKVIEQQRLPPPAPKQHNDIYKWCMKLPELSAEDQQQNEFILHWLKQ
jgi:hypothetical protein